VRSIGISVNVNGAVRSLLGHYWLSILCRRGDPEFPNTWQGSDDYCLEAEMLYFEDTYVAGSGIWCLESVAK
jgi:hypothetical protein